MSKKVQDMTREELQQMLDSFSESVKDISEGHIDKINSLEPVFAGTLGGNTNKESGWASTLGKKWGRTNMIEYMNKEVQCEHCGETSNLGNIIQYHKDGICQQRSEFEQRMTRAYNNGMSITMLEKEFNLTRAAIYAILINNNADIRHNQSLTEEDVWDILVELDKGVKRRKLANMYGVSKQNIDKIAQGKTWPKVQEKYKNSKVI
jgi:Mor family transcriptional regulator